MMTSLVYTTLTLCIWNDIKYWTAIDSEINYVVGYLEWDKLRSIRSFPFLCSVFKVSYTNKGNYLFIFMELLFFL